MSLLPRKARNRVAPYLLALPAALLACVFIFGVANGVAQGFGIMPFLDMHTPTLEYYEQVFAREDLLSSLLYSLYLALVSSLIALVGGVALSYVLVKAKAGRVARLAALQVPIMTMHALVAMAVMFAFSGSGLVARLLHLVGLVATPSDFPSATGATSG